MEIRGVPIWAVVMVIIRGVPLNIHRIVFNKYSLRRDRIINSVAWKIYSI